MSETADEIIQGMQEEMQQEPRETVAEPPPAAEPPAPEPPAAPDVSEEQRAIQSLGGRLLAGSFKTTEDLEHAYAELRARFGQQGNELGQLRQMVQQRQVAEQIPAHSNEDFEDWVIQNPVAAAEHAVAAGDARAYEAVMDIFYDENPKMAARYEQARVARAQQQSFQEQLAQATHPFRENYQAQEQMNAWESFRSQHPDVDAMPDQMASAVHMLYNMNPNLIAPLQGGTREQQVSVFETLYAVARGLPEAPPAEQPGNGAGPNVQRVGPVQDRVARTALASAGTIPPGQSQGTRTPDRHAAILEAFEREVAEPT